MKITLIEVKCPKCGEMNVIKHGRSAIGKQRYRCKDRKGKSFISVMV